MRLLLIHADKVEYEVTKKTKLAEEIPDSRKKGEMADCLFVNISIEKGDEKNPASVITQGVGSITDVAGQVKTRNVLLYPFVHLLFGSDPGSAAVSLQILKGMEEKLTEAGYTVMRAPFGYYKRFTVSCKGHPLAELSRVITAEGVAEAGEKKEEVSAALKAEEKVVSSWFIMEPSGKMVPLELKDKQVSGYDFSKQHNLVKFAQYEMAKSREVKEEPPHIALMRKLELVDYESASDPGNFRFMPKGRLVKSLLEQWVTEKVITYGAVEVETPIMYDYEHPALKSYLNRFPARQYTIQTPNKRVFLRFSACFGQFILTKDAMLSYRNLPFKIYELTRYSFRVEQRGELAGLRRLRSFTMPDMHTMCADMTQAKEEFISQYKLCITCMDDLGLGGQYEVAIRFTEDFWKESKDFVMALAKILNKPVLIEKWNMRFAYFDPKFEFNFVDALDKASALSTVQIDHENGERFGITYTDKDNTRKHPKILHCSPPGALERVIYALLEKGYMDQKAGKNPTLPLWLTPTQVRLCPVNDSLIEYAKQVYQEFAKCRIRADIDDRAETINRKIRDAEVEWIPYIIVIGEKERQSGKLAVRFRETGQVKNLAAKTLISEIGEKTKGFPFKPLPLSPYLSTRPKFA